MFARPEENVAHFDLTPGLAVADFGAGSGFQTIEIAKRLGPKGRVYAVEVQRELLDRLKSEARSAGVNNIEFIWGNAEKREGVKLAEASVDRVIISNLLFQSSARYSIALEAKRILRPDGAVVVIDWLDSFGGVGPAPAMVIKPDEAKRIFAEAGFAAVGEFAAGEHHYGIIFKKS